MNKELMADFAHELKDETNIDKHFSLCKELIGKALSLDSSDYDTAVTLFVMCVNKCLHEVAASIDDSANVSDDEFCNKVNTLGADLQQRVQLFVSDELNTSSDEDYQCFLRYLFQISNFIFGSFNRETVVTEPYDYEVKLRDNLLFRLTPEFKRGIPELMEFTEKHGIQIPYLYGWVFDFPYYCKICLDSEKIEDEFDINYSTDFNPGNYRDTLLPRILMEGVRCKELLDVAGLNVKIPVERGKDENLPIYETDLYWPATSLFLPTIEFGANSQEYRNKKSMSKAVPFVPLKSVSNGDNAKNIWHITGVFAKLYEKMQEEIKLKQESIDCKNKLIEAHAHNWEHYTYPNTIKEVADNLTLAGDYERAKTLHEVYNSEKLLRNDLTLIQQEFLETAEAKYAHFYDSVLDQTSRYSKKISDVVEDALRLVLFRLVMKGREIPALDVNVLRNSYTEAFMNSSSEQESVTEWFSRCLYPLKIEWNSPLWELPRFEDDGVAYMQILKIFMNLFHNVLNHGNKTKGSFLKLSFNKEDINQNVYLTLTISNPSAPETWFDRRHGKGLAYINESLSELNSICADKIGLEKGMKDNIFTVKLYFSEKLIIRRE